MRIEWDPTKALASVAKHGVSFEEAATAFGDPLSLTISDPDHSQDEQRWILMGRSLTGRLVVVAHTERGDTIRLISARIANRAEQRHYEQG